MRRFLLLIAVIACCMCLCAVAADITQTVRQRVSVDLPQNMTMQFVEVPAGYFLMGSPHSEEGGKRDEQPLHRVEIADSFYIGLYEVTQEQFEVVMGTKPPIPRGVKRPALGVSWAQASEFCQKLSELTGQQCRLPTEAEWEYACRAGTTTRYWFGNSRIGLLSNEWCGNNSDDNPKDVGTKNPNPWGLYDMHGNALEWCLDLYALYRANAVAGISERNADELRVARGGSFFRYQNDCRSATRSKFAEDYSGGTIGFRVVMASQNPETSQLSTKTLRTHTDDRHGFHLRYPDDWTVKEAITEATVFKAVKKFADGQYLMFTVNAQLLDRSDYTIDDISGFIRNVSEGDNVTVLDSGREQIGDVSCLRLLLDARRPFIQPRIEYTTNVIRNRYLYMIIVSCSKPLYQQHAQQIKQLGDSFTFTASSSAGSSVSTCGQTYDRENYRLVDKELGQTRKESWPMSVLIGFGKVFLFVLATSAIVGIGKYIFAKSKGQE